MNVQTLQTTIPPHAHLKTRIKSLNKHLVAEAITVQEYQRLIKAHLRLVRDWQERMMLENLALLPVEWRKS